MGGSRRGPDGNGKESLTGPVRLGKTANDFPAVLQRAGAAACFAADEFFSARISNRHTRRAYGRIASRFFEFCERENLDLRQVTPGLAGRFIRSLPGSVPTKNQALAAMRNFFDTLVRRHVVVLNPFQSVRGIKHKVLDGKTPELTGAQARILLASFDLSQPMGLRDRALFGTLALTGCRVGALCGLLVGDLRRNDTGRSFRFREKNGREREIPVRADLDEWIDEYMRAAKLTDAAPDSPLWLRGVRGRAGGGVDRSPLRAGGVRYTLKRRLKAAGLPHDLTPHSFRVMVVTSLLSQNVPVEKVQHLVGHRNVATTMLYDRRHHRITRDLVDKIMV